MKKLNILNWILKIMIVLCVVFIIGAVVYQNTIMKETTNVVSEDSNVVDNGDGTHTHTYTDENGETHEETHDNSEE